MTSRKNRVKIILVIILAVALFLRIYKLDSLELFGDEIDVGYHSYSLLKTGRDYRGNFLPFYIQSLAEWRAPLLMYVTVPFIAIFGLNEWGVRLPAVFCGVLSIFLLFKLVKMLSKRESLALWSAFILAVTPWHVHYSRATFEVTLLLVLILGGTIFFINKKLILSALLFGLTFYTYNTANVFVPLLILVLLIEKREEMKMSKGKIVRAGLVFLLICTPIIYTVFKGHGSARFKSISIFQDQKTVDAIIYKRTTGIGQNEERFFHNKLLAWSNQFLSNYSGFISPQFLFFVGDPNPRHNQPGYGEFLLVFAVFLILGFKEWKTVRNSFSRIILYWIILGPVAAALTRDGVYHATRLFIVIPPLVMLTGIGMDWFFCKLRGRYKSIAFGIVSCALILNLSLWMHNYLVHYPKESADYWGYGYKEAFTWLRDNDHYDRVLVNNYKNPVLIRYLFWMHYPPSEFQEKFINDKPRKDLMPEFDGFKYDNVYFAGINIDDRPGWLDDYLQENDVYLGIQGYEIPYNQNWVKKSPKSIEILKVVYDHWDEPFMYWFTKDTTD